MSLDASASRIRICMPHPYLWNPSFLERWLSERDTYTLHKPVRRRFKRSCVVVGGPNQQWQADLVDMSRLKKVSDKTTFILTVIDVFSKLALCVPLKNKSAASLVAACTQLLSNGAPNTLQIIRAKNFTRMWLYFTKTQSVRYVDVLQAFMRSYNDTYRPTVA